MWDCLCDCGNTRVCAGTALRQGDIKSCGCEKTGRPMKDKTGNRYGKLIVLRVAEVKNNKVYWLCLCDCGKEKIIGGSELTKGSTNSCGCGRSDAQRARSKKGETPLNALYNDYRSGAKRRGLEFSLTKEQLFTLVTGNCFYDNEPPSKIKRTLVDSIMYNGIDRVDNSKGYTIDNVVTCCWECNRIKLDMSKDTFLDKIRKIYEHSCNN